MENPPQSTMPDGSEKNLEPSDKRKVDIFADLEQQFLTSLHSKEGLEETLLKGGRYYRELVNMLKVTMDEEILRYAAGRREMVVFVAANPHTPADILGDLSAFKDGSDIEEADYFPALEEALYDNPNTPARVKRHIKAARDKFDRMDERRFYTERILRSPKPSVPKSLEIINAGLFTGNSDSHWKYDPAIILDNPNSDGKVIAALYFKLKPYLKGDGEWISISETDRLYIAFSKHLNTPTNIRKVALRYILKNNL